MDSNGSAAGIHRFKWMHSVKLNGSHKHIFTQYMFKSSHSRFQFIIQLQRERDPFLDRQIQAVCGNPELNG